MSLIELCIAVVLAGNWIWSVYLLHHYDTPFTFFWQFTALSLLSFWIGNMLDERYAGRPADD